MMIWPMAALMLMMALFHIVQEFMVIKRVRSIRSSLHQLPAERIQSTEQLNEVISTMSSWSGSFAQAANQLKKSVRMWEGEARLSSSVGGLFSASVLESGLAVNFEMRRIFPFCMAVLGAGVWMVGQRQEALNLDLFFLGFSGLLVAQWMLHYWVCSKRDDLLSALRSWVEGTIEPLPQAQELTRDMIFHLQKQISNLEQSHQKSLDYMSKSQAVLTDIGKNLQSSFSKSVEKELNPALTEIISMAQHMRSGNQKYIEDASQKQVQAVQNLIGQVMSGIDQAIGNNLRDTSDAFAASVQRQQVSMDRWRRSVDSVSEVIETLAGTTDALTQGAEKMAKAAEPVEQAAQVFSKSATQLQSALPAITEIAQVIHGAQGTLEQAHAALERGTAGYIETSSTVRDMVQNLKESHVEAIKRISNGVDEAVLSSMREAGTQLKDINAEQSKSLESWIKASRSVESSAEQMKLTSERMANFSEQIKAASEPTVQASVAFLSASEKLRETVPKLEDAASVHELGKKALEQASEALSREARRYTASANLVHDMVQELQKVHDMAVERVSEGINEAVTDKLLLASSELAKTIGQAAEQIDQSGQTLAKKIVSASEHTAMTLENSVGNVAGQLELSSGMISQSLSSSMEGITLNLQSTVDSVGGNLVEVLGKSSLELQSSLQGARQQMADTMTDTIRSLEQTLDDAGTKLVANWSTTGENIRDAMEHASSRLDQSVQEVGKKLNQRVDDAGRMLETSVTESATLLKQGAFEAQQHLSNVGTDWSSSIQEASVALRESASSAGQEILEKSQHAAETLKTNVEGAGANILAQSTQAAEILQSNVEAAGTHLLTQSTQAAEILKTNVDSAGTRLLAQSTQAAEVLKTNVESAGLSIFETSQQSGENLKTQVGLAGQTLLDNSQSAGALLSTAFQQADRQIQESLSRVGAQMENSLRDNHTILSETLTTASTDLKDLSEAQSQHLVSWTKIVDTLRPALSDLSTSTVDLDGLVRRLQETIRPTQAAAKDFKEASQKISAVFPNISETAQQYHNFNQSLSDASSSLSVTAKSYANAGKDMDVLLASIRQSMNLQSESNDTVSSTLDQAAETIRSLQPISKSMREAAGDIRVISEQTASTVDVIHRATASQNSSVQQMSKMSAELLSILSVQSTQLGGVTKEMSHLQQVLTSGVHAFSKTLPKSVDQTLVQFDSALGEGVSRLGSAIERLREAMDDLIEQLETVKKR